MKTVLVVEDNEDLRELVCAALRRGGYEALEAENGVAARDIIEAMPEPPCLVFLDLMMPVMGGAELLKELRDSGRLDTLHVVVLSAVADRQQPLGALRYVRKPVSGDTLLALAHELC